MKNFRSPGLSSSSPLRVASHDIRRYKPGSRALPWSLRICRLGKLSLLTPTVYLFTNLCSYIWSLSQSYMKASEDLVAVASELANMLVGAVE